MATPAEWPKLACRSIADRVLRVFPLDGGITRITVSETTLDPKLLPKSGSVVV